MKKTSKKTSKTQKNKLPIIHINAVSGSGKTTLGQKLKEYDNKFAIIELDDIDDPIALKMLNSPKYSKLALSKKEKDNNEYFDIKDKKGLVAINKLIKKYQKENKIVVMSGLSIDVKKIDITDKYYININSEQLFKQFNLRTLDDIVKNYKEIKSVIENEPPEKVGGILLHKYKLRNSFLANYNYMSESLKDRIKKNKDYKLMFFDEIFNDIISKYG
jgi:adenylate kinase family enzyme